MYGPWNLSKTVVAVLVIGVGACAFAKPIKVRLTTTLGIIRFELYPDKAPLTVANFLRYIDAGRFKGGSFYRVARMDNQVRNTIKIEVIQGGLSGLEN